LITSRFPDDLPAFMRRIGLMMEKPDLKKVVGI